MKSLSFPSAVEVLLSNLTDLQNQIPWGVLVLVLVLCLDPQAGKPDVGFRAFPTQGELLWYYCFPVCGLSTGWVWDFILLWLHTSYHVIATSPLSLDVGYLFSGGFRCPPVNGCETVAILVLSQMSAHSSTLPSWTNLPHSSIFNVCRILHYWFL